MGKLCLVIVLVVMAMAAEAATGRAMSLSAAVSAVKAGRRQDVQSLCGITRALGYLVDGRDIVVFGAADPALPALHLDDLVVALRNANMMYIQTRGRTRYYSAPGCSIDPDPQTMRDLRRIGDCDLANDDSIKTYLDKWDEVGRRPQKVRVMGVPFDTRFAKVMVDADYYMKRLVNGSVTLDIEGFTSLSDMGVAQAKNAFATGKTRGLGGYSMNRFWFSPAEATYTEQDGAIVLKSCRVQLLTEEEYLTEHGIAGKGRPGTLARQFAAAFSKHYEEIAAQRPIYTELEGLFRLVGIARIMKDQGAKSPAMDYLLKSYQVSTVPVNRQVLGLTACKRIDESSGTEANTRTFRMIMPSCGGVSMDVRPKRVAASTPTPRKRVASAPKTTAKPAAGSSPATISKPRAAARPAQPSLKKTVLAARKSEKAVSWDFELPKP